MLKNGRRELNLGFLSALGLVGAGCGGGGGDDDGGQPLYMAFNQLRGHMKESDVKKQIAGDPVANSTPQALVWESETERLEVSFSGGYVSSATWTDLMTGQRLVRTFKGGGLSGASHSGTLYEVFLALRPGMSKAEVIAKVRLRVSQGEGSNQVLWIEGQEALGVRFNGSDSNSLNTFAQWGLSIPAGNRDETRTF